MNLNKCKYHGLTSYYKRPNNTSYCSRCNNLDKIKYRAKKNNLKFNLNRGLLLKKLNEYNNCCGICGKLIDLCERSGLSLSWDQIEPGMGYFSENVQPSHWECNRLKGQLNMKKLLILCKQIIQYQESI